MRKHTEDCVGCGLPCVSYCPYYNGHMELICDRCQIDVDKLYYDGDEELCRDCMVHKHKDEIVALYGDQWLEEYIEDVTYESA